MYGIDLHFFDNSQNQICILFVISWKLRIVFSTNKTFQSTIKVAVFRMHSTFISIYLLFLPHYVIINYYYAYM